MIYKNCIFLFKIISFLRVAVVGNVDAGKSTLLGVLTHGELDNGRGFARQKLFRHKHEMESGRTSSVGNDILGFDQEGACGQQTGQPWGQPGLDQNLREVVKGHHFHRLGGSREVPEDHRIWHDWPPTGFLHANGERV
uniref:Tr-type G domain-containing protein n=1 Tax=Sinocyclocheilus rhinocerous TaxID=307959 RepID=A0A673NIB6_9TELE